MTEKLLSAAGLSKISVLAFMSLRSDAAKKSHQINQNDTKHKFTFVLVSQFTCFLICLTTLFIHIFVFTFVLSYEMQKEK